MTAERLFSILNPIALVGWVLLVLFPKKPWASHVVPVVIPAVLSAVYAVLVATSLPGSEGGFSSLAGVSALFANPWALLAGWTHYLAFDLFIGGWEVRDAQRRAIPHWIMIPVLFLTFMLGPVGLLLYLGVRSFMGKTPSTGSAAFE
jgi:hypothetical protein